ncbi:hypothetical protein, partial [Streptomyces sp. IBSBF 2390]|uniref:hypothetical protein n=1 Tax=Streptomyces sp. IBSBF 2390 TaxID=2903533 RepID=UPI002FDC5A75
MATARMLLNIGGPKHKNRPLLATVVSSSMLYAAPVFAHTLQNQEIRQMMTSVYRQMALRTISGYRTISENTACVIAAMIPIDLLALESARIYQRKKQEGDEIIQVNKKEEREKSLEVWRNRWSEA